MPGPTTSVEETALEAKAAPGESVRLRGKSAVTPARLVAAFAAVYVIWGSTYLAIRIGIESFPPLMLGAVRHSIAGLVLYPMALYRSRERPTSANWRAAALVG